MVSQNICLPNNQLANYYHCQKKKKNVLLYIVRLMSESHKNGIKIFFVIGTYSILTITKYVANINRTIPSKD